ncbi:MAG: UspA domain protein [Rhodopila sp.]|nr:UspA domain protein [Rhodopila sp.]
MSVGRIIVPVSGPRLLESKLDHALALAKRFHSRVDVLFLYGSVDPLTIEKNPFFGEAAWETAEINWSQEESAQMDVQTRLDRWSRERGAPYRQAATSGASPHVRFHEIRSDYARALQEHGRTSDVIVIGQPGRGMAAMDIEINKLSVMASGRPVLIVPNEPRPAEQLLTNMFVAWDGGAQASRTVGLAMPILEAAQQVTVYTSGDPDEARSRHELLKPYFVCNGITAKFVIEDHASRRIGRALLEAADRNGATLICMGAYENPRAIQLIIGGNTRHVYSWSRVPILLSF